MTAPAIKIREAEEADLPEIVALLADDTLGAGRERPDAELDPRYRRAFDEMRAERYNTVLVAEQDGAVVACLQLFVFPSITISGTRRAEIEGVRAARKQRGQGLGKLLIDAAIERARAAGCGLVQLTCNKTRAEAQKFYEGLGFEPSHVGFKKAL